MKCKTLFITGGLGYLGSSLAQRALNCEYDVVLYDNTIYDQDVGSILNNITESDPDKLSRCTFVRGDTRDREDIKKRVLDSQPDYIVHLGELVGVYACEHNPKQTEEINLEGTKNVVDIAAELDIPLLYNSSSSVYGTQKDNTPLPESAPLPHPSDLYCIYKLEIEAYIADKTKNEGLRAIVFRPATVCGSAPRMRIELLPNHFTYLAMKKGRILLAGSHTGRAVIDVYDTIDAYMKVLSVPRWHHQIYNLGHYNWTKQKYAETITRIVGGDIITNEHVGDPRNLGIDCTRFENEFDWKPVRIFDQSVKDIADWLRAHDDELEANDFKNIINMPLAVWKEMI